MRIGSPGRTLSKSTQRSEDSSLMQEPSGAKLYCPKPIFGMYQYCLKEPFGNELYMKRGVFNPEIYYDGENWGDIT